VKDVQPGTDSNIEMSDGPVSRRLSDARRARREDLPALAKRIGVREENLRAIEQGRFADLPPGIYGRAAIRSYATAFAFDPAEILAECESHLTPIAEPIHALGKLRGVRHPQTPQPADAPPGEADMRIAPLASVFPGWRLFAAAALDAFVVVALLLLLVASAITAMMVPVAALDHSGPMFGLMGLLLGSAYFVWFGGLGRRTMGEQVLHVERRNVEHAALTLKAIATGAFLAATEDARFIRGLGAWTARAARHRFSVRTAPQPEPSP
jgi:hypothetical protein